MKQKFLIALLAVPLAFSSCNKDEIDDLKERLERIENNLGDEPITFKYSTTNSDNIAVTKNAAYYFQSTPGSTHYIADNFDGTYDVYVERFTDIDWNDYVWFYFRYEPETGDISNPQVGLYYETPNFNNINAYIYECCYTENTVDVTVKSFNAETGKISVKIHGTTTTNSNNNPFSGKAQTLDITFHGTLGLFEGGGE